MRVLKKIDPEYLVEDAAERMASNSPHPLLAARGVYSLHRLRRRQRNGEWRTLGYAVWDFMLEDWIVGSWDEPVSFDEAYRFLAG